MLSVCIRFKGINSEILFSRTNNYDLLGLLFLIFLKLSGLEKLGKILL